MAPSARSAKKPSVKKTPAKKQPAQDTLPTEPSTTPDPEAYGFETRQQPPEAPKPEEKKPELAKKADEETSGPLDIVEAKDRREDDDTTEAVKEDMPAEQPELPEKVAIEPLEHPDDQPTECVESDEDVPVEKTRRTGLIISIIVLVAGITALILIAVFSLNRNEEMPASTAVIPTSVPAASPTPDPLPELRAQWTFEVQNGSGITGAAARAAEKLQRRGYAVVKTGNAKGSDYTSNELYISKNASMSADILIEDLAEPFNISTVSGTFTDSTAAARLIIGTE